MTDQGTQNQAPAPQRFRLPWSWLGVAPFFIFALMFLILPTFRLIVGAFQTPDGSFTLENIQALGQPSIVSAYMISLKISIASAVLGAVAGFALAVAIVRGACQNGCGPRR